MKKIFPVLLATGYLLLATATAKAQTSTPKLTREEFRARLSAIRDERKKTIVERIDQRMVEINANRTAIMLRHLTKIEEILSRIETRVDELSASGKDVVVIRTAIATARTAIATARTTVNAQTAKTYTLVITTEDRLGTTVSAARTSFAKDLQTAHQAVVTARKSVRDVLKAVAAVVGEKLTSTLEK